MLAALSFDHPGGSQPVLVQTGAPNRADRRFRGKDNSPEVELHWKPAAATIDQTACGASPSTRHHPGRPARTPTPEAQSVLGCRASFAQQEHTRICPESPKQTFRTTIGFHRQANPSTSKPVAPALSQTQFAFQGNQICLGKKPTFLYTLRGPGRSPTRGL